MSIWLHYWHERCTRADRDCVALASALLHCHDFRHRHYSAADLEKMRSWGHGFRERPADTAALSQWAEGAGISEGDSDALAALLEACPHCRHLNAAALHDYRRNRDRRYGALPAGATLQGNLASGGVTEF